MIKAKIIVDLGFGDSGKGITTDYFCKITRNSIAVRFSGGQQAGHNVKIGDISHIHSNYGSGTLRGYPSYFTEHCTIYPVTMFREYVILKNKGIDPKIWFHPLTMVTTPYDVAYNKVREKRLNHGSCGLGVGSTVDRNLNSGYKLYVIDISYPKIFNAKLNQIAKYYRSKLREDEFSDFDKYVSEESQYLNYSLSQLVFNTKSYDYLLSYENIIFEGSQGILLDMNHGIFPNVTYSNTTSKNALDVCNILNIENIQMYYITRCYQTRHGDGWMSNEGDITLINTQEEINKFNEWQKDFRVGEIDYDLLNYSYKVDSIYTKNRYKSNLVVTCLDQRPDFKFDFDKFNLSKIYHSYSPDSKTFKRIK